MKNPPMCSNPHANMEPTKSLISDLDFKLRYLCLHLGITQQLIAEKLQITNGSVTQWKTNGVPQRRIIELCRLLGITIDELQIEDRTSFELAIKKRLSQNAGIKWRFFYPDHVRGGLDIEIISKHQLEPRPALRALLKEPNPQHQRKLEAMRRISIRDKVRFRYPVKGVVLKQDMPVKDVILVVEHSGGIQVLSMDEKSPEVLIHEDHYYFPAKTSKPLSVGETTGMHSAFLLFLALPPPEEIAAIIQNHSGEVAVDWLAEWMGKGNTPFKIMLARFNVNN